MWSKSTADDKEHLQGRSDRETLGNFPGNFKVTANRNPTNPESNETPRTGEVFMRKDSKRIRLKRKIKQILFHILGLHDSV